MQRKLVGYFLLSFLSFCLFTGVFHAIANAQTMDPTATSVTPTIISPLGKNPTPTLYEASNAQPQQANATTQSALPTPTVYIAAQATEASKSDSTPTKVTPTPTAIPTIAPTAIPTPTATPIPQPAITVATDLESLFSTYSNQFHVDEDILKKIAKCESGFNATSNNSGMYLGMFQFSASTWSSNRARMGLDTNPDLRTNPEEAIRTAAYVIANSGTGAWPVCGR